MNRLIKCTMTVFTTSGKKCIEKSIKLPDNYAQDIIDNTHDFPVLNQYSDLIRLITFTEMTNKLTPFIILPNPNR